MKQFESMSEESIAAAAAADTLRSDMRTLFPTAQAVMIWSRYWNLFR